MASNLAAVISGGRQEASQQMATLQGQAQQYMEGERQERNLTMREEAFKMQVQEVVDQKAGAYLTVLDQENRRVSSAQAAVDEAQAAVDNYPSRAFQIGPEFRQDNRNWVMGQKAAQEALDKATAARDVALNKRNDLVLSYTRTPGVMAALTQSSMSNEYIGQQVFNEEIFNSMGEADQTEAITRLTAIQVAMNQQAASQTQAAAEAEGEVEYQKALGKRMGEGSEADVVKPPTETFFDDSSYMSRVMRGNDKGQFNMTKTDAANYWQEDIAPFRGRTPELKSMPDSDKRYLAGIFSTWDGEKDPGEWVNGLKGAEGEVKSQAAKEIIASLQNLASAKSHQSDRVGGIVGTFKGFTGTKQPLSLTPRVGSGE